MASDAYKQVMEQIQQLEPEEQLELIQDIAESLSQRYQLTARPLHSILELQGLGKELWQGIDVDQYIEEERNSWDDKKI
jgi:hypothetical protein